MSNSAKAIARLEEALRDHKLWVQSHGVFGQRLVLRDFKRVLNFREVDLSGAYLVRADLREVDLSGVNLTGAILKGALIYE